MRACRIFNNTVTRVLVRKRRRATLVAEKSPSMIKTGTTTYLGRLPVLSFFVAQPNAVSKRHRLDKPAKTAGATDNKKTEAGREARLMGSTLLQTTRLMVEHSATQECFTLFLRVLTALFLTVLLHNTSTQSNMSSQALMSAFSSPHGDSAHAHELNLKVCLLCTPLWWSSPCGGADCKACCYTCRRACTRRGTTPSAACWCARPSSSP